MGTTQLLQALLHPCGLQLTFVTQLSKVWAVFTEGLTALTNHLAAARDVVFEFVLALDRFTRTDLGNARGLGSV